MADDRWGGEILPEESPNTIRQHAAENTRASRSQERGDGKCHREDTAGSLATKVR
jgi:hypothetical protein